MHCLRLSGRLAACYDVYPIHHEEKHLSLPAAGKVREKSYTKHTRLLAKISASSTMFVWHISLSGSLIPTPTTDPRITAPGAVELSSCLQSGEVGKWSLTPAHTETLRTFLAPDEVREASISHLAELATPRRSGHCPHTRDDFI